MAGVSKKKKKTEYQKIREEKNLTRRAASEVLKVISEYRLERIESRKCEPHADEILCMAEKYKVPSLCNYYCSNECPIGKKHVPELEDKDLSQIVLEMLASFNSMQGKKDNLIDITSDGAIVTTEIEEFVDIQNELEKISLAVSTLQLWCDRMIVSGKIDASTYLYYKNKG